MRQWMWALVATGVGFAMLASVLFGRSKTQELGALGEVALPSRFDRYAAEDHAGYALFPFDRTANSFLMMGSNRPVAEALVIAVWTQTDRETAHGEVRARVMEQTGVAQWRREGDYQTAQGMHEVNTVRHNAIVLLREFPERQLTIGYRGWTDDTTIDKARRLIEETAASYHQRQPVEQYLRAAADRPTQEKAQRRDAFAKRLAGHGVELKRDGGTVERNGVFYEYVSDDRYEEILIAAAPLGDRPKAAGFRQDYSNPPKGVANWPDVLWFGWNGSSWEAHGGADLPKGIAGVLAKRHADPSRAYFYAVTADFPADLERSDVRVETLWRATGPMRARFAQGGIVQERR